MLKRTWQRNRAICAYSRHRESWDVDQCDSSIPLATAPEDPDGVVVAAALAGRLPVREAPVPSSHVALPGSSGAFQSLRIPLR